LMCISFLQMLFMPSLIPFHLCVLWLFGCRFAIKPRDQGPAYGAFTCHFLCPLLLISPSWLWKCDKAWTSEAWWSCHHLYPNLMRKETLWLQKITILQPQKASLVPKLAAFMCSNSEWFCQLEHQ
jgi:hypothetical protein